MDPKLPHFSDWVFYVQFFSLLLITATWVRDRKRFRFFLSLPLRGFSENTQWDRDSYMEGTGGLFLILNSYVQITFSAFIALKGIRNEPLLFADWTMYFRFLLVISLFFILKTALELIVALVFRNIGGVTFVQNIGIGMRSWLGLVLFPVSVLTVYMEGMFNLGAWVIAVVFALIYLLMLGPMIIRLGKLSMRSHHKFFYLCTLEIIPVIFLINWIISH